MDKDIKKSIDSIQVPIQKLDLAIEKGLYANNKQIMSRKKKIVTIVLSCVAAIGLLITSGFISPTMANVLAKVPLLESIFTSFGDKGLQVAINDENAVTLNKTITSNGVTINVQDVLYDGTRLAFSYVQDKAEEYNSPLVFIEANGEFINASSSLNGTYLPNGEFSGLYQMYPTDPLPNEFDLVISIKQVGKTKGDWQFETHVLKTDNNSVNLGKGQRVELDDISFEVKKFESTNSAVSLDLLFKGTPEALSNQQNRLDLHLLDQNGNPIPVISGSGSGDEKSMLRKYVFEPLSEEVSSLTISPFYVSEDIESKKFTKILDKDLLPLTFSQGDMGNILVTKIEEENELTAIYFESTISFPPGPNVLINSLIVEDSEGKDLNADGEYPIEIEKNKYKMYINDTREHEKIIIRTNIYPRLVPIQEAQITVKIPR